MRQERYRYENFVQFFEEPTRTTLKDLLRANLGETDQLDFKARWPDSSKLAKHIIAIGNSGGGAIVIGVVEEEDGSLTPQGLSDLRDKAEIGNELDRYIPGELRYEILNFDFSASEYEEVEGNAYQVVLVDSDEMELPYLPTRDGAEIKENRFYVRRDTRSVEANRAEIERIIETRANASAKATEMAFGEDLDQLRTLYNRLTMSSLGMRGFTTGGFNNFLRSLIQDKKEQIRERITGQ